MSAHKNSVPAPGLAAAGPEQSAEAAAPASSNAPAASEAPAATPLEPMSAFFAARVSGYDAHMLEDVQGCREGYARMAELVDMHAKSVSTSPLRLLDLGCGTGLELDEIFRRLPDAEATGVDLAPAMLSRLREKHAGKRIRLICGSYFDVDFGWQAFDCAVSFESLHHFSHREKAGLYRRLFHALRPGGLYVECDYMVDTQSEEDYYFAENARLRAEQGISADAFYHFDTPCTVANQISLLQNAGFTAVEQVFRMGNPTMLSSLRPV